MLLGGERSEKRCAGRFQLLLKARGAIAIAASPGLTAVFVTALAAVVRILHFRKIEILLPIRPFFQERSRAVTHFHPADSLIRAEPRLVHIAEIFAFSNRTLAERFILNGLEQVVCAAGFNTSSNKITHQLRPGRLGKANPQRGYGAVR